MALGIQVSHIGKIIQKKPIVRDVSLELNQGEIIGLLGPNGAGKTSTFYMIAGVLLPNMGTITINGINATQMPIYQRARLGLGYLPQEMSIFRGLNVENNIRAILDFIQPNPEKAEQKLESLLGEFSLTHLRHVSALALSGGERRRVEIARALASDPKFLLMDEPFAGVDPISVEDIRTLVLGLKNRGIGVLITDHNVYETLKIIDRGYIMADGRVIASGNVDEILSNNEVKRVYLGQNFRV